MSVVENVADRRYDVLRSIYYGASPIAESTLRGVIDAFGCGFVQSYGMTEAAQALTFLTADDHRLARDVGDLRAGITDKYPKAMYAITSPPTIYRDLVIVGPATQEGPDAPHPEPAPQRPAGRARRRDDLR